MELENINEATVRVVQTLFTETNEFRSTFTKKKNECEQHATGDNSKFVDAHKLLYGVIAKNLRKVEGQQMKVQHNGSHTLMLLASFVRGMELCEETVIKGQYIQAAALIRQELETVARIEELKKKSGVELKRKTPNVSNTPFNLNLLYGALSEVSHVSSEGMLSRVLGSHDKKQLSFSPQYHKGTCFWLYGFHLVLAAQITYTLLTLFEDAFESKTDNEDVVIVNHAFETIIDEKWLIHPSEKDLRKNIY